VSHTLHPLRRQRLHRSELAVPASNPTMIEKAADSAADVVFLDLEDAVAPPEKEQARKNAIEALNDIDWAGKGKTVSVRINGLDTHYMYRDVVDIMETGGRPGAHAAGAQGRRSGGPLHGRGDGQPDRAGLMGVETRVGSRR
jgi:malyl-CoA/(S)-citramalyl-CoA lyase